MVLTVLMSSKEGFSEADELRYDNKYVTIENVRSRSNLSRWEIAMAGPSQSGRTDSKGRARFKHHKGQHGRAKKDKGAKDNKGK